MPRRALTPPFAIHGRVTGEFFADRADEVQRVLEVLRTPGEKLLVRGRRRMGKTSILDVAGARAARQGVPVLFADLSTAQTLAEVASRLMLAANDALGRRWKPTLVDIAKRLTTAVQMTFTGDGRPVLSLSPALFAAEPPAQARTLADVLDAINATAAKTKHPVAIVLDEFQEIEHMADRAAWHLRGVIQRHDAVSYVCAGSRQGLIDAMTSPDGAFYKLLDPPLEVGPIDAEFLARWIESRLATHGVRPAAGVGARCVALAGPCTLDVMLLARTVWERSIGAGKAAPSAVDEAFAAVVSMLDEDLRREWERCSTAQQQALRAVAGATAGLTTAETIADFGLGPSGSVMSSVGALVEREVIRKDAAASATGYVFDRPFLRGWVIAHALPDLGKRVRVTALPRE
ncbi:MAG TPA: ATP-binding protein [Gemmatimonadaceae bacterium]